MKTWGILKLGIKPENIIGLCCPHCGTDAAMPIAKVASPVIAAIGLNLVFDDPGYYPAHSILPKKVRCRYCRHIFES